MKSTRSGLLRLAEHQMQERRIDGAIKSFRLYLRGNPNDLRALLQLGICYLLNRSEREFEAVHRRVRGLVARIRYLPDAINRMWQLYGSLAAKTVAAAAFFGALSLPGAAEPIKPLYAAPPYRPGPVKASPTPSPRPPVHTVKYMAPPHHRHPVSPAPSPRATPKKTPHQAAPKTGNARIKPSPQASAKPRPTTKPGSATSPSQPMLTKYGGPRYNPEGQ